MLWCLARSRWPSSSAFISREPIFAVLVQPLLAAGQGKLIYTDIFEAFFVEVKVALFAALMISFPVIATQLWRFVAPGLYAKEKKALPAVPADDAVLLRRRRGLRLFRRDAVGAAFPAQLPRQCRRHPAGGAAGVGNYLNFVTRFLFGFGVAFLLPILLMILERAGIVTREQLAKSRRYAIVAAAAIAAVLTPPDVVSMLMLLVPLYGLYEFAILAIRHHALARGAARRARLELQRLMLRPRQKRGPETPPGGGRVGGSGPI